MKRSLVFLLLLSTGMGYCQQHRPGDTINPERKKLSEAYYKKGNTYYQGCHVALKYYDSAIAANPYNADAWREKSVHYLKSGQYQLWAPPMNKAVELAPVTYLGVRARCLLFFLRDYDRVIHDVDSLETLVPNLSAYTGGEDPLYLRALAYLGKKEYQKAIDNLNRYVAKYVQQYKEEKWVTPNTFTYRALCELKLGHYEKALSDCEKFNSLFGNQADGWYWKGKALAALGRQQEATAAFQKAREYMEQGRYLKDDYVEVPEQLYREDIEAALRQR